MAQQPILFFHGALGAASQFTRITEFLHSKGEMCKVFEFEGHGHQPLNHDFSMSAFADQVKDQVNAFEEKPLVFGYSMGGYAALLASLSGASMAGLITLGTKMLWTPEIAQKERRMLNPEKLMEKVPAFAKELELRHQSLPWTNLLERTADMMTTLGDHPPLVDESLLKIQIPVLYALGDRDEMVSAEETIHAYRQTPGAVLSILPGTRHPIEKIDPELMYFLIQQWRKMAARYPTTQKVS